ncbi:MAG: SDR family oxidoreductase [Burkholderiaceae bacterium]
MTAPARPENRDRSAATHAADTAERAVLVTGGAQRLGREIALGMAAGGWQVAVHYRGSEQAAHRTVADIEAAGGRAVAVQADLNQPAEVTSMFAQAASQLPIRALVNNASHFAQDRPETVDAASLLAHWQPNLAAPVLLSRCLFEALGPGQRGRDQPARPKAREPEPGLFSYTLAKQALWGATRMMAMAYAPRLRVVGVSPGLTLPSYLQSDEAFEASHRGTALLDHSSRPQDIVQAVCFLADQSAITGINLLVDGGQHLVKLARDVSFVAGPDHG